MGRPTDSLCRINHCGLVRGTLASFCLEYPSAVEKAAVSPAVMAVAVELEPQTGDIRSMMLGNCPQPSSESGRDSVSRAI